MQFRYDEDFIEAAVFLCASGRRKGAPSMQVARFHREREKLYRILDPDDRNAAFFNLHLEWFREWRCDQALMSAVAEFPLVGAKLRTLGVRKTVSSKDEGAEMYVNELDERTGLLTLRIERLEDDSSLSAYLRHEFMHFRDMVDTNFGYYPELQLPGLNPAQRRLARERYRLLWDITIDGRLAAAGWRPMDAREQHAAAFGRAYVFWDESRRAAVFDELWSGISPTHAQLLELVADPRGLSDSHGPMPGAPCPLCEFPTFSWASASSLSETIASRIREEFPRWETAHGICVRCLEMYRCAERLQVAASQ